MAYRVNGDFEGHRAGEKIRPEDVERYLARYPYMVGKSDDDGEEAAAVEQLEAAGAQEIEAARKAIDERDEAGREESRKATAGSPGPVAQGATPGDHAEAADGASPPDPAAPAETPTAPAMTWVPTSDGGGG